MFGKLKEALKKSLSLFSKKAQEEAEPIDEVTGSKELKKLKEEKIKTGTPKKITLPKKEIKTNQEEKFSQKKEEGPIKEKSRILSEKSAIPSDKSKEEKPYFLTNQEVPTDEKEDKHQKSGFMKRLFGKKEKTEEEKTVTDNGKASASEEKSAPTAKSTEKQESKSFISKAKEIFTTKRLSQEKFEELFWDIELALLENNVGVEVVHKLKEDLRKKIVDQILPRDLESVVQTTLKKSIEEVLSINPIDLIDKIKKKKPFVIAFFGINGSGKTTTIAKIAKLLQANNLTCVLAAGDTFRAAAIQQLEEHAQKLNLKIIKHDYGADAAAVAFDAVKFAEKNGCNAVLIDTAGRLHSDSNLMDELKKLIRVAKPDLKLFVGESITGNDCIDQTQKFDEHIGIDAIILTKSDVDEKGGTALSISYITKKPILFIGNGQSYSDISPFNKEMILKNIGLVENLS